LARIQELEHQDMTAQCDAGIKRAEVNSALEARIKDLEQLLEYEKRAHAKTKGSLKRVARQLVQEAVVGIVSKRPGAVS
jgi:FAD/FMN-containing dehydrogenase